MYLKITNNYILDTVKCQDLDDDSVSCGGCGVRYPLAQLSLFIQHKSQGGCGPAGPVKTGSGENVRVISPDSFTERLAAEDLRKKSGIYFFYFSYI